MNEQAMTIAERLRTVEAEICAATAACGRRRDSVTLVAVSKTHAADAIRQAWTAGCRDFGESYAQELAAKAGLADELPGLRFHFLGPLQSNKARFVAGRAVLFHAADRQRILETLDRLAGLQGARQKLLFEVHLSAETTKAGCTPDELLGLVEAALRLPAIEPVGLMTMPPYCDDAQASAPYFARLKALRDQIRTGFDLPGFAELSMGMSHDFPVAIREGATLIRVGTAIFGERSR
jgi:pyridoxal phosphate enzyme (YggS family)